MADDTAPAYEALPQREHARGKRRRTETVASDPGGSAEREQATVDEERCTSGGAAGSSPAQEQEQRQAMGQAAAAAAAAAVAAHPPIPMPEYRSAAEGSNKFEYLDHTADVQLHSWGETLEEAFANVGLAMYNYMTPLEGVKEDAALTRQFSAQGHDMHSLLYAFLDELLFVFHTEMLVCCRLVLSSIDRDNWSASATGYGERFERGRHEQGTEVKAITFSAMQVRESPGDAEVFVIVDI